MEINFLAHLGTFSNVKETVTLVNSSDTVITDDGSKYTQVLSPVVKSEKITVQHAVKNEINFCSLFYYSRTSTRRGICRWFTPMIRCVR